MKTNIRVWCTRCRIKKQVKDPQFVSRDGKNKKIKGLCPTCGTKISSFLPSDTVFPTTNK